MSSISSREREIDPDLLSLEGQQRYIFAREEDYQGRVFGVKEPSWFSNLSMRWTNDLEDYNARWARIKTFLPNPGRVLDMSAGYGTFLQFGLRAGHDVYGVEPDPDKLVFYPRKVELRGDPEWFKGRFVPGVGENLPFKDGTFDLVTSYGTLEYVTNLRRTLDEMLRVLKPGGVLHISTSDHGGFFEATYRVPQVPFMPRLLAKPYLRFIGRPLDGLNHLQWVTAGGLRQVLSNSRFDVEMADMREMAARSSRYLPGPLRKNNLSVKLFTLAQRLKQAAMRPRRFARDVKQIELWVTKVA